LYEYGLEFIFTTRQRSFFGFFTLPPMHTRMKLFFSLLVLIVEVIPASVYGQKSYFKNGPVIEDSLTYLANKEKEKAKFEVFAKPVVITDRLEIIRQNQDSIVYSYHREIKVGKGAEETPEAARDIQPEDWEGRAFPLPELPSLQGQIVSMEKLKGKPTLINFWFTSCAPCIAEMPVLNNLRKKYGESVNFVALAADSEEKVRNFLAKRTFNFVHVVNEKFITEELHVKAFPKNVFLDKNGNVYQVEDGIPYVVDGQHKPKMGDGKEFEFILDRLLAGERGKQ
jgi:cytochrome c biogenesis protein CcmG/thiol:disulfide interchange protein DsbE